MFLFWKQSRLSHIATASKEPSIIDSNLGDGASATFKSVPRRHRTFIPNERKICQAKKPTDRFSKAWVFLEAFSDGRILWRKITKHSQIKIPRLILDIFTSQTVLITSTYYLIIAEVRQMVLGYALEAVYSSSENRIKWRLLNKN